MAPKALGDPLFPPWEGEPWWKRAIWRVLFSLVSLPLEKTRLVSPWPTWVLFGGFVFSLSLYLPLPKTKVVTPRTTLTLFEGFLFPLSLYPSKRLGWILLGLPWPFWGVLSVLSGSLEIPKLQSQTKEYILFLLYPPPLQNLFPVWKNERTGENWREAKDSLGFRRGTNKDKNPTPSGPQGRQHHENTRQKTNL